MNHPGASGGPCSGRHPHVRLLIGASLVSLCGFGCGADPAGPDPASGPDAGAGADSCWYSVDRDDWLAGNPTAGELQVEHDYGEFAAPTPPDCDAPPQAEAGSGVGLRARLVPIVFSPSDTTGAATGDIGDPLQASLERVQAWLGARVANADGRPLGFHLERVTELSARLPLAAYFCSGRENCSQGELPDRVIAELTRRGVPLFTGPERYLIVVRGAGLLAQSYRRSDGGGSVAIVGDDLIQTLTGSCDSAGECPLDAALAHVSGHLFGLEHAEGADRLMAEFSQGRSLSSLTLSDDESAALAATEFFGAGSLQSGTIALASERGTVYDVSFGDGGALVVWGKNVGPERLFDIHFQTLAARLVRVDGSLGPRVDLATRPENDFSLGDREASVAYDSDSDAFQVVFHRYWSDGGNNVQKSLRARRVSASTGQPLGPDVSLTTVGCEQPVETDLAYSPDTDSFLVVWARTSHNIGEMGSTLYAAELAQDGTVLGDPIALAEGAKYPSVAYDPSRSRFLVTWTLKDRIGWRNTIEGRFVRASGQPDSPAFAIRPTAREAMLSEAAYDPASDRFLVAFWETGDVHEWDILTQTIRADSGALVGPVANLASGPARFQYDPAVAYSPARGSFLVSYGDDPGDFFDGLGHVRAQWVDSAGRPEGFSLWLRPEYDAHSRSEVAAHPGDDLAAAAWSGEQGISVDIFQTFERRDRPSFSGTKTSRVMVVVVDPILPGKERRLRQHMNWHDPTEMTFEVMEALHGASGGFVDYQIMAWHLVDDFPVLADGYRYDEGSILEVLEGGAPEHKPSTVDYAALLGRFDICDLVVKENLSEVWVWGFPGLGTDEYAMKFAGDQLPHPPVSGSWYRPFNIPDCGKTLWVMGWNYEREIGSAMHSFGHRVEGTLSLTVGKGRWYENESVDPDNPWRLYSLYESGWPGQAGVGSVHEPPNSTQPYQYDAQGVVQSTADDWLNYPNLTGAKKAISCAAWGCTEFGYMKWYLGHLPRAQGTTDGAHNNWWKYIVDYDGRLEGP